MTEKFKYSSTISKIFGVNLLKSNGDRIMSSYYTKLFPSYLMKSGDLNLLKFEDQREFEKKILEKCKKLSNIKSMKPSESEIFTFGNFTIIFKMFTDVYLFVIGDNEENELVLLQAAQNIQECLSYVTKNNIRLQTIQENYDLLILIIDEILEEGIIITLEPATALARALMKDCEAMQLTKENAQAKNSFLSAVIQTKNKLIRQSNYEM